ncbi:hypothetical protein NP233_g5564 [Leucocoprinus birnbaumii]|uniref:Uncharacterized protein n=1 Tax=Leucocoprinus birnbaumii TaxID=56174 RepID=A0AAD5VUY9_9AGAR|nr:hypothetical protein NP233_g5564 [Leucocoprinus birnbaumii]
MLISIQVDDDGADKVGRLIFIPGDGHSENVKDPNHAQPEILSKYDGSDWIDNSCDGWVKVEVQVPGSDTEPLLSKHHATVISGPPNFSWGINAPTTLFNIMESIYWYRPGQPAEREVDYDFTKDIWPTLILPGMISWTNYEALQGHGPSTNGHFASDNIIAILKGKDGVKRNNLKNRVFEKLRKPDYEDPTQAGIWWMPRMSGDNDNMQEAGTFLGGLTPDIRNYTALTKLQYECFRKWKDDPEPLSPNWTPEPPRNIEYYDKQDQPEQLTLVSLESTIGDSLFPGMETDWIAKEPAIYDLSISNLRPPFRINYDPPAESTASPVKPGHLSRGLAIPWQSDFWECSSTWWPSSRPNNVITKAAYENTMGKSGTQSQYDKAVHTRSDWTRGFRATPDMGQTETSDNIPLYSNTDMVRYWHFLGFVRKYQKDYPIGSTSERTFTAWVESE